MSLLVSIVIDNFNYAEFLGQAIDSALAQRYGGTEVIVVDDGSSDHSRQVIGRYDGRVRAVLKENGGQASAFNAGFAASRGDIVIFLDADDVLLPDTAAHVSEVFARQPGVVKVHYRLGIIDAHSRPTGGYLPPRTVELPEGDLRRRVLRAPDDVPYPPTSGNAFSASALRRLLPMPERHFTRLADVYLLNLASLLGRVARLDHVGAYYRVHARNIHYDQKFDLDRTRAMIRATSKTHEHLARLAASLDLGDTSAVTFSSVTDLAQRLVSLRLEPEAHPVSSDTRLELATRGVAAALGRSDAPVARRLLYACWFACAAVLPRTVVYELAERLVQAWHAGAVRGHPAR